MRKIVLSVFGVAAVVIVAIVAGDGAVTAGGVGEWSAAIASAITSAITSAVQSVDASPRALYAGLQDQLRSMARDGSILALAAAVPVVLVGAIALDARARPGPSRLARLMRRWRVRRRYGRRVSSRAVSSPAPVRRSDATLGGPEGSVSAASPSARSTASPNTCSNARSNASPSDAVMRRGVLMQAADAVAARRRLAGGGRSAPPAGEAASAQGALRLIEEIRASGQAEADRKRRGRGLSGSVLMG